MNPVFAPPCDIVLPVYNNLGYVRECIDSVLAFTPNDLYRLYIMDDCGDAQTAVFLKDIAAQHPQIEYHRNAVNQGFVKNCNIGMKLGSAPYVLLLNSDIIVTPNWLERLLACAERDNRIASVNPLTNHASNINVPMAIGASFLDMNRVVAREFSKQVVDVVTGVGFCMLLRRAALDEVGMFDEIFGMGYCEESDLCMRLTTHGWRTVSALDVYVYHKGGATFTNRNERYLANRKIFDVRWAEEYKRQYTKFRSDDPLGAVRRFFAGRTHWTPLAHMRETYRELRHLYRQRLRRRFVKTFIKQTIALPRVRTSIPNASDIARFKDMRDGRLRVTYVLPTLGIAGGVLSVIQLVNQLILMGIDARIVAAYDQKEVYDWKMLMRPMVYGSFDALVKHMPQTDIVVATHFKTAKPVQRLMEAGKAKQAVYFLQDYEAWFFPEEKQRERQQVIDTYALFLKKIVKSDWLAGMLAQHDYKAHKIPLGMNLDVFYPRKEMKKAGVPVIMAMARPSTPRRGYDDVIAALYKVTQRCPDVRIILFGDVIDTNSLPFACESVGSVVDQNALARLYSQADIFLDGSTFQGFGRPALEAMACGAACVLTNVGGVNEYARDGENCLLVPPSDPQAFAEAILHLMGDIDLGRMIVEGGLRTVKNYCHRRESVDTLRYFQELLADGTKSPAIAAL